MAYTLTWTNLRGPASPGTQTFETMRSFLSAAAQTLANIYAEDISATLADGTRLDQAALKALVESPTEINAWHPAQRTPT
jgi:hypothetical protein